jgi:hypothetical protein
VNARQPGMAITLGAIDWTGIESRDASDSDVMETSWSVSIP